MFIQSIADVAEGIHKVQKGIVRRIVWAKVSVYVTIGEILGAYIVGMVVGSELTPIGN